MSVISRLRQCGHLVETDVLLQQKPIPECKVYANGTIYRILLERSIPSAPPRLSGGYPLCYQINDEGKWCYYTGGFCH